MIKWTYFTDTRKIEITEDTVEGHYRNDKNEQKFILKNGDVIVINLNKVAYAYINKNWEDSDADD